MARNTQRKIDESLRKELEWSGVAVIHYRDQEAIHARACPLCYRVCPQDHTRQMFPASAIGHKDGCDLAPRITLTGAVIS